MRTLRGVIDGFPSAFYSIQLSSKTFSSVEIMKMKLSNNVTVLTLLSFSSGLAQSECLSAHNLNSSSLCLVRDTVSTAKRLKVLLCAYLEIVLT